ncbi:type B 50S ribosomal protein L31 [Nocardioides limicola]|uniref:type B 50S ribosomal protein L31 n=1 Tax=Nocardioides limicola TaxID=2803368 RepID=UPI00193B546B|nr:type B 50S ribosomal protein L31 [Nocardioides sp. DJM-14]
MKQGIHPEYRPLVFRDRSTGKLFLTKSTRTSDHTVEIDGQTYPVVDVDVSSDSHPFWTGKAKLIDSEGRVEAFERRYGRKG